MAEFTIEKARGIGPVVDCFGQGCLDDTEKGRKGEIAFSANDYRKDVDKMADRRFSPPAGRMEMPLPIITLSNLLRRLTSAASYSKRACRPVPCIFFARRPSASTVTALRCSQSGGAPRPLGIAGRG